MAYADIGVKIFNMRRAVKLFWAGRGAFFSEQNLLDEAFAGAIIAGPPEF